MPRSHVRRWDFSRDGIRRSLEESLERLGLDRVDIAFLHDPDDHWHEASTTGVDALIELRDEGVLGAVGAGMKQSAMLTEFVRRSDIDVVMLAGRYSLLDQSAAMDLLPLARQRNVAVVAVGVYNSGISSTSRPAPAGNYDYGRPPLDVVVKAERIAAICDRYGIPLPVAAIQFPFRDPAVTSVVVGCRTASQVTENLRRRDVPVPFELWEELEAEELILPMDEELAS